MDTDTSSRSTMVLADSMYVAPPAAGDQSALAGPGPGGDAPLGARVEAELAAATVGRIIREMIDADARVGAGVGAGAGDGLSRFEAPGFAADGSAFLPGAADGSCHESPRFGSPAGPDRAEVSQYVAGWSDAPASLESARAARRIALLVRELIDMLPRAGIARLDEIQACYPQIPEAAFRLIAREAGRDASSSRPDGDDRAASSTAETPPPDRRHDWAQFPAVGETVGDYRLLAALGRGVRGAVFLADQPSLANRPVVLKITARDGREHLSLAQLRHPHIVPLYCVQELPERNLRLLCMPYLGGASLTRALDEHDGISAGRRSGRDILAGLDQIQARAPLKAPDRGPAREFLARASYSQAIAWIGACLADALHFAHQRNLVHLDLKPSNILIAADGTPMLLDFHLAQPPIRPRGPSQRWLGGTPRFMSPEQRLAMLEIHERAPITVTVDGRSDIYALGLVLYHLLGGTISIGPYPMDRIRLRRPRHVSIGLADVLARCLAFNPNDRYPDAGLLVEDLRRHLAHRPLRGVRNRSVVERGRKWSLRHPQAVPRIGRAIAAASAIGLAGWLHASADARHRFREAESLLAVGRAQMERGDYPAAALAFSQGLNRLDGAWLGPPETTRSRAAELRKGLDADLARARRARLVEEIHALTDRARLLYGAQLKPSPGPRELERRLGRTWNARHRILSGWSARGDGAMGRQLRADLLDLCILWSDLRVRLAPDEQKPEARREALQALTEAERLFGPSPVLSRERQNQAGALGLIGEADSAARAGSERSPQTAWEHYALGRSLLAAGDLDAAARAFDRATSLHPQDLWAQFSRGLCAYRQGRYDAALAAFDVCVALSPATAACYYNRGLAHAALGHAEQARRDEEQARRLAPGPLPNGLLYDRGP